MLMQKKVSLPLSPSLCPQQYNHSKCTIVGGGDSSMDGNNKQKEEEGGDDDDGIDDGLMTRLRQFPLFLHTIQLLPTVQWGEEGET